MEDDREVAGGRAVQPVGLLRQAVRRFRPVSHRPVLRGLGTVLSGSEADPLPAGLARHLPGLGVAPEGRVYSLQ